jgi:predicted O-linked N-acetylglucosamine transferase (SPINDLY family)
MAPSIDDSLRQAIASLQVGRLNDAERYFKEVAINDAVPDTWNNRGTVLNDLMRYDDAIADFDKAISLQPNYSEAFFNRGKSLAELKRYEEACAAYDRALALKPDLAGVWIARGNVSYQLRRYNDALASYDKALTLKPDLVEAWLGCGNVFFELKRYDEAIAAYDRALTLKPDLAEAWLGRGNLLNKISRKNDALAAHDRALTLKPDLAEAWVGRGWALFEINRPTEALAAFDKALAIRANFSQAISSRIFVLDFADDAGFEEQQKARDYWWREVGSAIAERSQTHHVNSRDPGRRIKVGYVSADFRRQSAAYCFRPILLNHDKARFEITCYSSVSPLEDDVTEDFRRAADRWRDVARSSDDELCEQIKADQIDILVDLSGHTDGNRLGVFARKPAPIQVTAWGHATGTGLPTIDYLFSDPVACPEAARPMFAEKVFDLPCLLSIEPLPEQLGPFAPPVLSKGHVTFGVFNRANKISDNAVSLWARILHAVPRSQILIKDRAFDEAPTRSQLLERFAIWGIAADRVACLGATSRQDHLAAFKEVDISLDPFPNNGGISTWESLQIGVPVVAKLGNTIPSRLAGAILTSVGMGDWVADSADGYLAVAVKFASVPDHLEALRQELPSRISASAAGNSATYTKTVEAAYRTMWADYCGTAA